MGPDADKLRQRGGKTSVLQSTPLSAAAVAAAANGIVTSDTTETIATDENRLCSLATLRTTEVCIDGVIYDIANFDHPGGDSIQMFGGNDVTVQYNMIHPYHTDKHLEKMKRVGKVIDFTTE